MWGYYWGFTSQEIALMAIDQPIVVYDHDDKKKKKAKKARPLDVVKAENEWKQKYEGKEDLSVSLDLSSFGFDTKK